MGCYKPCGGKGSTLFEPSSTSWWIHKSCILNTALALECSHQLISPCVSTLYFKFVSLDKKNTTPDTTSQTVVADGNVEEILEEGLKRLKDQGTWKVWSWDANGKAYIDAEAFRREAEVGYRAT